MDVALTAQLRDVMGKGPSRRLRQEKKVPAVLYGPKMDAVALTVSAQDLEKLLREIGEESKLLQLAIEGGAEKLNKQVLIREIQVHPFRKRFLHVDFFEVPLDVAIEVEVLVELQGEAVGVKKGGDLDQLMRTVTVKCFPDQIPEKVIVDVTALDLGGSIRVSDLKGKVPYDLVGDPHYPIVTISSLETPASGEGAEAGAE